MGSEPRRLSGRLANGAERGKGSVYHAVPGGEAWGVALCGAKPGRRSGMGFLEPTQPDQAVTCPRCLKRLAAAAQRNGTDEHEPEPPNRALLDCLKRAKQAEIEVASLRAQLAEARAALLREVDRQDSDYARVVADMEGARGYLTRLFQRLAPQCQPQPDLGGICTQVDNYIAGLLGLREQALTEARTALEAVEWVGGEYDEHCPWCHGRQFQQDADAGGHTTNCLRQLALGHGEGR